MVFIHCTKTMTYDHMSHKRIFDYEYIEANQSHFHALDVAYYNYERYLTFLSTNFTEHVNAKLIEWDNLKRVEKS